MLAEVSISHNDFNDGIEANQTEPKRAKNTEIRGLLLQIAEMPMLIINNFYISATSHGAALQSSSKEDIGSLLGQQAGHDNNP